MAPLGKLVRRLTNRRPGDDSASGQAPELIACARYSMMDPTPLDQDHSSMAPLGLGPSTSSGASASSLGPIHSDSSMVSSALGLDSTPNSLAEPVTPSTDGRGDLFGSRAESVASLDGPGMSPGMGQGLGLAGQKLIPPNRVVHQRDPSASSVYSPQNSPVVADEPWFVAESDGTILALSTHPRDEGFAKFGAMLPTAQRTDEDADADEVAMSILERVSADDYVRAIHSSWDI